MSCILKVEPEVSDIDFETLVQYEERAEYHNVPFGVLAVNAFHDGALLREAVAQYWQPEYVIKDDETGQYRYTALSQLLNDVVPQGLLQSCGRNDSYDFPIEVLVILTYPLQDIWQARAKIPAYRFGEVFSIAHDIYTHVYNLDDAYWRATEHQAAPQLAPGIRNRARGKYVWGHDMRDLAFEAIGFIPAPTWPSRQKQKQQIVIHGQPRPEPEDITVLRSLSVQEHADKCPFIGTVIFSIGS